MQIINGIARRRQIYAYTPAELAIRDAIIAVEAVGADVKLTEAVVLLGKAADAVADYVEREDPNKVENDVVWETRPRTIADEIEEYKKMPPATRKLIRKLTQALIDAGVNITIER